MADATVSRIERGRFVPSVNLVERMAKVLGVSVDMLLAPKKREPRPEVRASIAKLVAVVRPMDDAAIDDVTKAVKLLVAVGKRTAGSR